jgi:flavin-dependent thymidylate synthase
MKVTLINYTGAGSPDPARLAANVLVFTKSTRLEMSPGLMEAIERKTDREMEEELNYISNTLPSSWEMVDYTFLIEGVTRAFTHQLVRTRTGSYAQQAMRILKAKGWAYATGPTILDNPSLKAAYDAGMEEIDARYQFLIEGGAKAEDARGILPTNFLTNIVAKFNLRTLADTIRKRSSGRVQDEYRAVVEGLKSEAIRVHPWADSFLNKSSDKIALELQAMIREAFPEDADYLKAVKLLDQLRAFTG